MPKRSAPIELTFIEPCSPTLVAEPPAGDRWIHEIKHDGFRTQLIISGQEVRGFTRNGHGIFAADADGIAELIDVACRPINGARNHSKAGHPIRARRVASQSRVFEVSSTVNVP